MDVDQCRSITFAGSKDSRAATRAIDLACLSDERLSDRLSCHIFAYLATLRFDRKARDMQQKYELRMKEIREEMAFGSDVFLGNVNEVGYSPISKEKQRKKQIQQIEELDAYAVFITHNLNHQIFSASHI